MARTVPELRDAIFQAYLGEGNLNSVLTGGGALPSLDELRQSYPGEELQAIRQAYAEAVWSCLNEGQVGRSASASANEAALRGHFSAVGSRAIDEADSRSNWFFVLHCCTLSVTWFFGQLIRWCFPTRGRQLECLYEPFGFGEDSNHPRLHPVMEIVPALNRAVASVGMLNADGTALEEYDFPDWQDMHGRVELAAAMDQFPAPAVTAAQPQDGSGGEGSFPLRQTYASGHEKSATGVDAPVVGRPGIGDDGSDADTAATSSVGSAGEAGTMHSPLPAAATARAAPPVVVSCDVPGQAMSDGVRLAPGEDRDAILAIKNYNLPGRDAFPDRRVGIYDPWGTTAVALAESARRWHEAGNSDRSTEAYREAQRGFHLLRGLLYVVSCHHFSRIPDVFRGKKSQGLELLGSLGITEFGIGTSAPSHALNPRTLYDVVIDGSVQDSAVRVAAGVDEVKLLAELGKLANDKHDATAQAARELVGAIQPSLVQGQQEVMTAA